MFLLHFICLAVLRRLNVLDVIHTVFLNDAYGFGLFSSCNLGGRLVIPAYLLLIARVEANLGILATSVGRYCCFNYLRLMYCTVHRYWLTTLNVPG